MKHLLCLILYVSMLSLHLNASENNVANNILFIKVANNVAFENIKPVVIGDGVGTQPDVDSLESLNTINNVVSVSSVFSNRNKFSKRHEKYGLHAWYKLQFSSEINEKIIEDYKKNNAVVLAQAINNYEKDNVQIATVWNFDKQSPTDPPVPLIHWNYWNRGQFGGKPGADINVFEAWDYETGDPDVVVALFGDNYPDRSHVDLASSYVNTYNTTPKKEDEFYSTYSEMQNMSAGILAASNNNIGVVGIAGGNGNNSGIKLLPIGKNMTLGSDYASGTDLANALVKVADEEAVIFLCNTTNPFDDCPNELLDDAINYFVENAGLNENDQQIGPMSGGIIIMPASKNNFTHNEFLYKHPKVVSVAATDNYDMLTPYSSYGEWVDICAPGGSGNNDYSDIYSTVAFDNYRMGYGTVLASAHVAGVTGLIVSNFKSDSLTADQVLEILLHSTDNIDEENPEFVGMLGAGRLNALKAFTKKDTIAPLAIDNLELEETNYAEITLTWTAPGTDTTFGRVSYYDIRYSDRNIDNGDDFEQATQILNYVIPQKAGSKENFTVKGLTVGKEYYFAIRSVDAFENISQISNVAHSSLESAPQISVEPQVITVNLDPDSEKEIPLTITNTGDEKLTFSFPYREEDADSKFVDSEVNNDSFFDPWEHGKANDYVEYTCFTHCDAENPDNIQEMLHSVQNSISKIETSDYECVEINLPFEFNFHGEFYGKVSFSPQGYFIFTNRDDCPSLYKTDFEYDSLFFNKIISIVNPGYDNLLSTIGYRHLNNDAFLVATEYTNKTDNGVSLIAHTIFYRSGDVQIRYWKPGGTISNADNFNFGIKDIHTKKWITPKEYNSSCSDEFANIYYKKHEVIDVLTIEKHDLEPGESTTVMVEYDSDNINKGNFVNGLTVTSNDPYSPEIHVTSFIHINGEPKIEKDSVVEFEHSTCIGASNTYMYQVRNVGTDTLIVDSITIQNTAFSIDSDLSKLFINEKGSIAIIFEPTEMNEYVDTLRIYTNMHSADSIVAVVVKARGVVKDTVSVEPSRIAIALGANQIITDTIFINNSEGKRNLDWSLLVPFSEELFDMSNATNFDNLPSRLYRSSIVGDTLYVVPNHDTKEALVYDLTTLEIARKFNLEGDYDCHKLTYASDLLWTIQNDTLNGYSLSGSKEQTIPFNFDNISALTYNGDYFIASFNDSTEMFAIDFAGAIVEKINVEQFDQIINLKTVGDLLWVWTENESEFGNLIRAKITDGNLVAVDTLNRISDEFRLQDGTPSFMPTSYTVSEKYFVAIWDDNHKPLYKNYYKQAFLSVDKISGTVEPAKIDTVIVTINAESLFNDYYYDSIAVVADFVYANQIYIPFELTINRDVAVFLSDSIVELNDEKNEQTFYLKNIGEKAFIIDSLTIEGENFHAEFNEMEIAPSGKITCKVTFSSEQYGEYNGKLLIHTSYPNFDTIVVLLKGFKNENPLMKVSPDTLYVEIDAGDSKTEYFTISNINENTSTLAWDANIHFMNDSAWLNLPVVSGKLLSAEIIEIPVRLEAMKDFSGDYFARIYVESNDTANKFDTVSIHLHVNGKPYFESEDSIKISAFINTESSSEFFYTNTGSKSLVVDSVICEDGRFGFSFTKDTVSPNEESSIIVVCQLDEIDTVHTELVFYQDGDVLRRISVVAIGTYPPRLDVKPTEIFVAVAPDGTAKSNFLIGNNGGGELIYTAEIQIDGKSIEGLEFSDDYDFDTIKNLPVKPVNFCLFEENYILYNSQNDSVFIYDRANDTILFKFLAHNETKKGIAVVDSIIWIGNNEGFLFGYNLDGTFVRQIISPFQEKILFTAYDDGIFVCKNANNEDASDCFLIDSLGNKLEHYTAENLNVRSIVWGNGYLWALDKNEPTKVFKYSIEDTILICKDTIEFSLNSDIKAISHDGESLLLVCEDENILKVVKNKNIYFEWITLEKSSDSVRVDTYNENTLFVDAKNIDAGDYTASLVLTCNDPKFKKAILPVYIHVGYRPLLVMHKSNLVYYEGRVNQKDYVIIENTGSADLEINIDYLPEGLVASDEGLIIKPKEIDSLPIVNENYSYSTASNYVIISSNDVLHPQEAVLIEEIVPVPPNFTLNEGNIEIDIYADSTNIASVELQNACGCDVTYTVQEVDGGKSSWLTILNATGEFGSNQSDTIKFEVSAEMLDEGFFSTELLFQGISDLDTTIEIRTITINVLPHICTDLVYEIDTLFCEGQTLNFDGIDISETGVYEFTYESEHGCDSIIRLTAQTSEVKHTEFTVNACEMYVWNNDTIYESGDFTQNFTSENGCDSIVTLTIVLGGVLESDTVASACSSFEWYDNEYVESGEYTRTFEAKGGCDSIVTLYLEIGEPIFTEKFITACQSYELNGVTYKKSGDYELEYTTSKGCDSIVKLHLTIIKPSVTVVNDTAFDSYLWNGTIYTESGIYTHTVNNAEVSGCDSIVELHLIIYESNEDSVTVVSVTACGSYSWNGIIFEKTGIYKHILQAHNGLDSLITLNVTILEDSHSEEELSTCSKYEWHGEEYSESGIYTAVLESENGCDSVITLKLTITEPITNVETVETCGNYFWNGEILSESGTYTKTLTASSGCDSIAVLHLVIHALEESFDTIVACGSYFWNGAEYYESGNYRTIFESEAGCDSIVNLTLKVKNEDYYEENENACDSYKWHDRTLTESGSYSQNYTNAFGCDSLVVLNLDIQKSYNETIVFEACGPFSWNGKTYSKSDIYTETLTTSEGCDSIITLDLTVNTVEETEETVEVCSSYEWQGEKFTQSGTYFHTVESSSGCDSVLVLHLSVIDFDVSITVNENVMKVIGSGESYQWLNCEDGMEPIQGATQREFKPLESGNYAVEVINNGCSEISQCFGLQYVSVDSDLPLFYAYPNPTTDIVVVNTESVDKLWVSDANGTILYEVAVHEDKVIVDMKKLAAGIYYINGQSGNENTSIKVVKE